METKVKVDIDSEALDAAIEKTNRLVELLREAKQLANSLPEKDIQYLRESVEKKCKSTF